MKHFKFGITFAVLMAALVASSSTFAASASLSPATLDLNVGQTGTIRLSGDDGRSRKTFTWSYPSGLNVSKGSSSNLRSFSISTSRRTISIQSRGRGSFSADITFSSNNDAIYNVTNTRDDIALNPADMSINVGSSSGSSGGSSGGSTGGGGMGGGTGGGGMGGGGGGATGAIPVLDATNVSLVVRAINKTAWAAAVVVAAPCRARRWNWVWVNGPTSI